MRNPEVPTLFPSSNMQPKTLPPVKKKEDRKTVRQTEIPVPPRLSLSPLRWTDRRTTRQGRRKKKNIGSCLDLNIQYSTVWKADDATPQITDPLNVPLVHIW